MSYLKEGWMSFLRCCAVASGAMAIHGAALAVSASPAQEDAKAPEIDRIAQTMVRIVGVADGRVVQAGSGTIVDPAGTIYTNLHVITGADDYRIEVIEDLADPPVLAYWASVVGYSREVDFALLQIDRNGDGEPVHAADLDLPSLSHSASGVRLGHKVFLFGFPTIGEGRLTYTEGIVASVRKGTVGGQRVPVTYQTDAVVGSGSSGGLAVNMHGEMVGLPTARHLDGGGGALTDLLAVEAVAAARSAGLDTDLEQLADAGLSMQGDTLRYQQEPTFGHASLRLGFRLDSAVVVAGGRTDVSYLGNECVGSAAAKPDFRFELGGERAGLGIHFVADDRFADPILVVRGPAGNFSCDDDSGLGLDPFVWLEAPDRGRYDIWAGTLDGTLADGVLLFMEDTVDFNRLDGADDFGQLEPELALDHDDFGQLDHEATPSVGEVSVPGFLRFTGVEAGGRADVSHLGPGCVGSAASAPVLRVWTGEPAVLGIRFQTDGPDADPTLIIRGPDGSYTCADDGPYGYDPSVWLDAGPGRWDVWIGSYDGTNVEGTLSITVEAIDSYGEGGQLDHEATPSFGEVWWRHGFFRR